MLAMSHLALLVNPESGSGDAGGVADFLRDAGAEVTAFDLARLDDAVASNPERIVVAGGDGSLGPVAVAASRARVPLAVVPVGTANDLARKLGLPDNPAAAARLAARGTVTRRLDLAWMGERPFLNVASIGLAPVAARKASGMKRLLGPFAYAIGGARAAATARPVRCRIACDGDDIFAGEVWQATVASSGAFGGGAEVEADPADGMLDAVAIEAGSRLALARRAHGLRRGSIGSQPGVRSRRAQVVELDVPAATSFNVDGELVESGPVRFEVDARAVDVVVGE